MKFKKLVAFIGIMFLSTFVPVSAEDRCVNIALVGNLHSGKTSIFRRMLDRGFAPDERQSDKLVLGKKTIVDGSNTLTLTIWDTAGLKSYYDQVMQHLNHMNFVLIINDLSQKYDAKVEAYLTKIYRDVSERIEDDGKVVIVGSKYDLRHRDIVNSAANAALIERVAKVIPTVCILTSASDNVGIDRLIDFIKEQSRRMVLPEGIVNIGDSSIPLTASKKYISCEI